MSYKDINLDMIPKGDSCWYKLPGKMGSNPCPYISSRCNYPRKSVTFICSLMNQDICKSSESLDNCKICGFKQYDENDIPPFTDEQKEELDRRIEQFHKWEEEGTLDEHTISIEELYEKIERKYGCLRDK